MNLTTTRNIHEIHERTIERLAHVIFTTRHFCGDEQSAISDFLKEEEEVEEIRFTVLERVAITLQATLCAYEWERAAEERPVNE